MIEVLTIVKNTDEKGNTNYSMSGSIPLHECAIALISLAFQNQQNQQKPEEVVPCEKK